MALSDLVIRPRTDPHLPERRKAEKALQYASGVFAEVRLICGDLIDASYEPAKRLKIARELRGRAISAKATVDDALEALAASAIEAAAAGETTKIGSTEGESAALEGGDAPEQPQ